MSGTSLVSTSPASSATFTLDEDNPLISCAAIWLLSASFLTSAATTAKPFPCSPARAASIAAFNASRFVDRVHDFMLQIRFLNELFPDAFYIILKRDPRAVVNSQYKMMSDIWSKNGVGGGINYGRVIEKFANGGSLLETCINYYNHYVKTMEKDLFLIEDRTKIVHYEDFVKNPRYELKKLYEYTDLPHYDELEKEIPEILELKSLDKWGSIPDHEKEILEKAFK